MCGIYSTLGITGHFVLFFTVHFGGSQNEGTKCVVYTALWASLVILYCFPGKGFSLGFSLSSRGNAPKGVWGSGGGPRPGVRFDLCGNLQEIWPRQRSRAGAVFGMNIFHVNSHTHCIPKIWVLALGCAT